MNVHGIHHITSITGDAPANYRFYTSVLGLRLVKKTVNQDDTTAYHLFYADAEGSPGTDITFFDWPSAPPARRGTDRISGTVFRVADDAALEYWQQRLADNRIVPEQPQQHMGRTVMRFEDAEGQPLALAVDNNAPDAAVYWEGGGVPEPHAIRGFFAVELEVPSLQQVDPFLTQLLSMERTGEGDGATHCYTMDGGGPGREVWIRENPDASPAVSGRGAVHHVAFRLRDGGEYQQWAQRLNQFGVPNSGEVDRFYFQSLYFRVSRGILFELATDGPGFAVDENSETLGQVLALPPFLEPRRASIEARLVPLDTGST